MSMWAFLGQFFKNNGHLRGALYFTTASLAVLTSAFVHWTDNNPKNVYEIIATLLGALSAGLIALRAYLDTHLSRFTKPEDEKPTQVPITDRTDR